MAEALWSGIVAGYGIAVPVGAIGVLIVSTAMRGGFRVGAAAGAGAATADLVYAMIAVLAGGAVAEQLAGKERPIALASAAVLLLIAGYGLWRAGRGEDMTDRRTIGSSPLRVYMTFVALTIVNPMTVIYFSSLIIGLGIGAQWSLVTGIVFAASAFAASLSWQWLLAVIGAFGHHRLGQGFRRGAVVVGNLVVVGFAVVIVARAL